VSQARSQNETHENKILVSTGIGLNCCCSRRLLEGLAAAVLTVGTPGGALRM
jgi:hypothetical protein